MPDVFVSYNREDREVARAVAGGLEAEGFSVWWDAALRAGEYYEEVTEKNLRSASAVVVLWSKRSVESKWVRAEATVGERSSILVPALIEECDRPVRFELVQTADLTRWTGDRNDPNWRAFVQDVRAAADRGKGGDTKSSVAAPTRAEPSRAAAAPSGDSSVTIETTFWNSIKDGSARADFEAYLARYPHGHFADLAKNRLAALERAQKAAAQRPQTAAAPAARAAQVPAAARPATQAAQKSATRPAPPPAQAQPEEKRGGSLIMIGVAAALIVAAVAGFFMMRSNSPAMPAAATAPSTPQVVVAEPAKTAPPETNAAAGEVAAPDVASGVQLEAAPQSEPTSEPSAEPPSEAATADVFAEAGVETPKSEEAAGEAALEDAIEAEASPAEPTAQTTVAPAPKPAEVVAAPKKVKPVKGAKQDCESCPLMASLPGGSFAMGSPSSEAGRNAYEGPQHEVTVKPFRIGVYEVTAGEWAACVADGACPAKRDLGGADFPALGVSWREAQGYVKWLSKKTGKKYRLPSEAEWEYAARAGTVSAYWWGEKFDASKVARGAPKPVGGYAANAFGLYDTESNAREWVEDCYVNNFSETPRDGAAAQTGDCSLRVIRGGYWASPAGDVRVANRSRISQSSQPQYMGFRVAADAK